MRRAYAYSYAAAKPDVVVFLGDLLDEMVFSSPEELENSILRFREVFPTFDNATSVGSLPQNYNF